MIGVDHADLIGAVDAAAGAFEDDPLAAGGGREDLPLSLPFLVVGAELAARLDLGFALELAEADAAAVASLPLLLVGASSTASLLLPLPDFSFCGLSRQLRELLPLLSSLSFSLSCFVLARAEWTVSQGPSSSTGSAGFSPLVVTEGVFGLDADADPLLEPEDPDATAGAGVSTVANEVDIVAFLGISPPFSLMRSAYEPRALNTDVVLCSAGDMLR